MRSSLVTIVVLVAVTLHSLVSGVGCASVFHSPVSCAGIEAAACQAGGLADNPCCTADGQTTAATEVRLQPVTVACERQSLPSVPFALPQIPHPRTSRWGLQVSPFPVFVPQVAQFRTWRLETEGFPPTIQTDFRQTTPLYLRHSVFLI